MSDERFPLVDTTEPNLLDRTFDYDLPPLIHFDGPIVEYIDGKPVEIVFLLVCDEEHTNTKLKALARVSRLLHREEFRQGLAASTSTAEAMRVIVDEEARHRI